jgi:threonylcarbamoyladenosine tRNA methylthiotransferase MtaB
MTSFSLQNFGCRVNQAEAFEWAEAFQRGGLRFERDPRRVDLIIVNTCTLTSRADRDVRKFLARVRRENPTARIIVTGCFVERSPAELEGSPNTILIGNAGKDGLAARVLRMAAIEGAAPPVRYRARGLLKVQDGCDGHCTFCVIPSVRGRSRSVPPQDAVKRLAELAAQGFREVVLTGIHLSSYGADLEPRTSLLDLLRAMEGLAGSLRLRLSSLDPRLLGPELRRFLAASPLVQPHFHLSLQHASDAVLARMGRRGRGAEYREILDDLRRSRPDAALGADIITGFPAESEEDFAALRDFLAASPLTYFHVFSYSPRPGTAAAAWPAVDPAATRRRTGGLRAISAAKSRAFRESQVGRTLEAVVIRTLDGRAELLTGNYIKVQAESDGLSSGDLASVTIGRLEDRVAFGSTRG